MEADTFKENLTILDEWEVEIDEKYRLVDLGVGPNQLQEFKDNKWRKVSLCYEWGIVTTRLAKLVSQSKENEDNLLADV